LRKESTSFLKWTAALFKQSFYPSLKGEAKEAASIGHKLEVPFCRKLDKEDPDFKAAFQVGLVEKIDQPWVKCSADFVSITSGGDGGHFSRIIYLLEQRLYSCCIML